MISSLWPGEYTDGYAYRNSDTGPNGGDFVANRWSILAGGLDGAEEAAANEVVGAIFGTYTCTP